MGVRNRKYRKYNSLEDIPRELYDLGYRLIKMNLDYRERNEFCKATTGKRYRELVPPEQAKIRKSYFLSLMNDVLEPELLNEVRDVATQIKKMSDEAMAKRGLDALMGSVTLKSPPPKPPGKQLSLFGT